MSASTNGRASRRVGADQVEVPFTELHARRLGPIRRYFAAHPVAMDRVVVAWFLVPALITEFFVESDGIVLAVLAVLGGVALFWRRHTPLRVLAALTTLAVIAIGATGSSGGFELALAFAIYAVATRYPPRIAWLALIAANAAVSAALLIWGQLAGLDPELTPLANALAGIIVTAGFTLVALAIGTSVGNRRDHVQRLIDRANQLALERDQRELLAAATERARIAREMHDVVAHSLSVMIALADGAGASLTRSPERSAEALRELSGTGRAALADMRRILGVLREDPAERAVPGSAGSGGSGGSDAASEAAGSDGDAAALPMAPQPGAPALSDLVARFRATGLPVHLTFTGPALPDDAGLQLTVYRIVQEGLTNVLRHAPGASYISVTIARRDNAVTVSVRNDAGSGQTGPAGSGKGLVGMRERAAVYDGTVEAGPDAGGWRLRAVLHFERKDEDS
ncbi:sensor histidine kinase [Occultella gossypii]|uniref:histidine kinase n=1 Tax=Occultella gossypii TaxID=2800820 RepID=A0ABS7SAA6_9MICO|nr:histidine kinase [Occultella gossypii]MBZ2196614.1 two-component sensor histidine kinase [Occultella gossypii]